MGGIACRHRRRGPACGGASEEASEDTGPWSQSGLRELGLAREDGKE